MSRELRFVLILLGSIFGVVLLVVVPLVLFARHAVRSAFITTPAQKSEIAHRISVIPHGYRATDALELLGTSWAQLTSRDDANIIELAQAERGNVTRWGSKFQTLTERVGCARGKYAGSERIDARWQDPTLSTWTCTNGAKIAFGQFLSKGGRATISVAARSGTLDRRALVEIFDSEGDIRPQ